MAPSHLPLPSPAIPSIQQIVPNPGILAQLVAAAIPDGTLSSMVEDTPSPIDIWTGRHLDYSDNAAQLETLHHHYSSAFDTLPPIRADYRRDAVLHQVMDGVPATFRGPKHIQQCLQNFPRQHLDHVAINHNHGQVIWRAETASHGRIVGTDSFTFDSKNRIVEQTTVAMSEK